MQLSNTDLDIIDNLSRKQLVYILEAARGEKCHASEDIEDLRMCLRMDLIDGTYSVDLGPYASKSSR